MKVVCIDTNGLYVDEEIYYKRTDDNIYLDLLELDKVYDIKEYVFNLGIGYIINHNNNPYYYNSSRFTDISFLRSKRLDELGIG